MREDATAALQARADALAPWRYSHAHGGVRIEGHPEAAPIHGELGRGRDLLQHVIQTLARRSDAGRLRAIDLGCLEGHYTDLLCEAGVGEVVAVDLSERHVERARFLLEELKAHRNVAVFHGDLEDRGFLRGLGQFDIVLFHGLLYHLQNPLGMFESIERMRRGQQLHLLLSTQFKGPYRTLVSPLPLAEVKLRNRPETAGGRVVYAEEESVYAGSALRLNPAAIHTVLTRFGYKELTAYDTPLGSRFGYSLHLVASKEADDSLLQEFDRGHGLPGVRFYPWDGRRVDGHDFGSGPRARLVNKVLGGVNRAVERLGSSPQRQLRRHTIPTVRQRPKAR